MSYSASEGIEDLEKDLAALKEFKKQFPDALLVMLPNGERAWGALGVDKVATHLRVVTIKHDEERAWLVPHVIVKGKAFYDGGINSGKHAGVVLAHLEKNFPEVYKTLVDIVARDKRGA